ncbi:hypothetical protein [Spirulina major]|nr:hypothetical protein [Spirulina major]
MQRGYFAMGDNPNTAPQDAIALGLELTPRDTKTRGLSPLLQ